MAEYINKENLKFMKIPIAPVIQGEQVHCEDGFLKEWLESVPTEDVVEREKIDKAIEEIMEYVKYCDENLQAPLISRAIYILKRNIGESK